MTQLHKRFTDSQVKELIERYLKKEIERSYIKDRLEINYDQKVSLPTIIDRAKRNDFYLQKPKRSSHDREVLTNYVGELIQHDSSLHRWSPYAAKKWYLITSLDDFSRLCFTQSSWRRRPPGLILRHWRQ